MGGSPKPLAPKRKKSQNQEAAHRKGAVFLFYEYDAIPTPVPEPILAVLQ